VRRFFKARMEPNNPFADPKIATSYENWYLTDGRLADRQEKALLLQLLRIFPTAHTLLDIGCGTGHFTRWFGALGLQAVGLDLSQPMLDEANGMGGMLYVLGDALKLPFPATSFDITALITTLEFLEEPMQVLYEALRVARHGIILGVLNAQSCLGRQYKREGGRIWDIARFYTPAELKGMIQKIGGEKAMLVWRTTLWPLSLCVLPLPWGGFIGMAVKI
jgi:ubiquinone/menaquinone biosynthesis C-methylase UbiE